MTTFSVALSAASQLARHLLGRGTNLADLCDTPLAEAIGADPKAVVAAG